MNANVILGLRKIADRIFRCHEEPVTTNYDLAEYLYDVAAEIEKADEKEAHQG